ncbi:arginyltransferase [Alteromonas sp. a30]|uniref:arginyltransferase n=1 Tax=Alteromonas sp. a30 TaxID=2730917 RepID=UPI00227E2B60|nr:arginyltransferase [Alteromonas sp. a30]MCY7293973.1 arginyltransferase [Alteromonas sp. a30]
MKFGITQPFDCSYIPENKERLLVYVGSSLYSTLDDYEKLLESGFRRSGDQVYRPQCPSCHACQSLRVPVSQFKESKSQKRILNKNKDIECRISRQNKPEYYELYARYIEERHADGSMYPPTPEQFLDFLRNNWAPPLFIELICEGKIAAVAVTDELRNSLSALYTFYDPDLESRSLGTLAILHQIKKAQAMGKEYVYLGYQIDTSRKMNYKRKFLPNEQYIDHRWVSFQKKCV